MKTIVTEHTLSTEPFFIASIPLIPPGINQSYAPATSSRTGEPILVHSAVAKQFLKDVALYLGDYTYCQLTNPSLFNAISSSRVYVPLSLQLTLFYETLWLHDVDGPDKIVQDALFTHLKKIARQGSEKVWNDNRVVEKITRKYADRERPRFELSLSCAAR